MWRAMASLLVLRDQVNALAPDRDRASDGLVGDEAHQATSSDHNPHYVEGVGRDIVTALDLTHDPAGGFDSYAFAEVLRQHRDKRIKYVISNRRLFTSYLSGGRPAWTWGPYSGSDPHTNHVHISVLDDPISDTRTPWNLEGFDMALTPEDIAAIVKATWNYNAGSSANPVSTVARLNQAAASAATTAARTPADLEASLDAILAAALDDGDTTVVLPPEAIADLGEIKAAIAAVPDAVLDAEAARLAE